MCIFMQILLVSPPPTILNSHWNRWELKVFIITQLFYILKHEWGREVWLSQGPCVAGVPQAYFSVAMTKATSREIPFAQILPSSRPRFSAWPTLNIPLRVVLPTRVSVVSDGDAFLNPNQSIKIAAGENSSYVLSVRVTKYAWSYKHRPVLPFISGKKKKRKNLVLWAMQFQSCLWKSRIFSWVLYWLGI